ncbi:hypothetical protein DPMN_022022 [Dreissena polymorpha]|uniref:Uncharacterized protein n=1 Tax=Dreissena polymorpha TaxID=45954 RepID=A0A9D4SAH3_DREPO|nr:hypothetical protein DPMN_022022 [Dreissena polymorpha]
MPHTNYTGRLTKGPVLNSTDIIGTNVFTKFHEDLTIHSFITKWAINVSSRVFTRLFFHLSSGHHLVDGPTDRPTDGPTCGIGGSERGYNRRGGWLGRGYNVWGLKGGGIMWGVVMGILTSFKFGRNIIEAIYVLTKSHEYRAIHLIVEQTTNNQHKEIRLSKALHEQVKLK